MQNSLFFEKITIRGFLFISLLVVILFSAFYFIVEKKFEILQRDELDRYISIIEESIKQTYKFTDDYEYLSNKTLYQTAVNIKLELADKKADEITFKELISLKEKNNLDGLAIFVKKDDDIIIINSSTEKEIGVSTKSWGYWHRTFKDLLNNGKVKTKIGFKRDDFWAGPRTYSYFNKGYYKFSYILSKNKNYLINPYISDERLGSLELSGHIRTTLTGIKDNIEHIDDIAIIDAALWKKNINKKSDEKRDPPVIYGTIESKLLYKTKYNVDEILSSKTKLVDNYEDMNKKVIFDRLTNNRILIMIVNSKSLKDLKEAMAYIFVVLGIVTILSISIVSALLINKYSGLVNIEKERLNIANKFTDTIKKLPDLVYQCSLDKDGKIFLIYNEGKFLKNHEVIIEPANKKDMAFIYGKEFMDNYKSYLYEAFHKKSVRFEAKLDDNYFDHIVSPVFDSGIDKNTGHIKHIMGFATDITDRVKKEKDSSFMARNDALTGLPNRFGFEEHVNKLINSKSKKFYLLFMDLDGFKEINDTAGHNTGDKILKEVSLRLKHLCQDNISIGRIGGDEFAGCFNTTQRKKAVDLAQMILINISSKIDIDDKEYYVGASIGISEYPGSGKTYKDLMDSADKAMYKVKKTGGNNFTTSPG